MHADGTLLPLGQFPKRPNIHLRADIELASSPIKFLLDAPALLLMLLAVLVLALLVAVPDALAPHCAFFPWNRRATWHRAAEQLLLFHPHKLLTWQSYSSISKPNSSSNNADTADTLSMLF